MIVTEKEAGEKACVRDQATFDGRIGTPCLSSRCMAWRWAEAAPKAQFWRCTDRFATVEPDTLPPHIPGGAVFEPYDPNDARSIAGWALTPDTERKGFCGLAGIPNYPV